MARRVAKADRVGREELLTFLRSRRNGVLLATRSGGGPQLSPITYGLADDGDILISTYPQRAKVVNLRRSPETSLISLGDDFNDAWVQIDGVAEVTDIPESVEPLVEYFRSISGEHPDWDEYREAMVNQGKSVIRIRLTGWGPIATGGFPPSLVQD
ncbi:PPOX class F420-dependent oxidoreductase [Williamsia sterculiae]|uniref:PPOX class probable F420-dependent enzyme n=1 Tax=Williamsia sterculiae TaxID=1344003 RepID=A0A1N7CLY6_9NOCA|nr:PPOX class F420-dependent oxidoreductase [Williamsia sterculiae]SIR64497.1 PPOX class probable F420-dependent enzyme [Williamsia sterculiae]